MRRYSSRSCIPGLSHGPPSQPWPPTTNPEFPLFYDLNRRIAGDGTDGIRDILIIIVWASLVVGSIVALITFAKLSPPYVLRLSLYWLTLPAWCAWFWVAIATIASVALSFGFVPIIRHLIAEYERDCLNVDYDPWGNDRADRLALIIALSTPLALLFGVAGLVLSGFFFLRMLYMETSSILVCIRRSSTCKADFIDFCLHMFSFVPRRSATCHPAYIRFWPYIIACLFGIATYLGLEMNVFLQFGLAGLAMNAFART